MVVEYTAYKGKFFPRITYEPNAISFSDQLKKDSSSDSDEDSNNYDEQLVRKLLKSLLKSSS